MFKKYQNKILYKEWYSLLPSCETAHSKTLHLRDSNISRIIALLLSTLLFLHQTRGQENIEPNLICCLKDLMRFIKCYY